MRSNSKAVFRRRGMIQNFIQEQVDTLARTLQRSVAIDDVGINLVAVSKHFDDADDACCR